MTRLPSHRAVLSPEADLDAVIKPFGRELDDASIPFFVRLRAGGILTDQDWDKIKAWLRKAMLLGPDAAFVRLPDGTRALCPDADPRNADWLRIAEVWDRTGYNIPMWAALWLWWLHGQTAEQYWEEVGSIAATMGIA
jgi:hypothetical protein